MRPSGKDSGEYSQCDLVVDDSTFRVVSVEMDQDGELWVWLPWSLDYLTGLGRIYALTWDSFGQDGLN